MSLYLLDTNIISDIVRHPSGFVSQYISKIGEENICTSIIVACELRFGAEKSESIRLKQQLDKILNYINILPFEMSCVAHYAKIRTNIERAGTPIGANDLLIAAHALAINAVVVTANVREFIRVPNLKVENWLDQN